MDKKKENYLKIHRISKKGKNVPQKQTILDVTGARVTSVSDAEIPQLSPPSQLTFVIKCETPEFFGYCNLVDPLIFVPNSTGSQKKIDNFKILDKLG